MRESCVRWLLMGDSVRGIMWGMTAGRWLCEGIMRGWLLMGKCVGDHVEELCWLLMGKCTFTIFKIHFCKHASCSRNCFIFTKIFMLWQWHGRYCFEIKCYIDSDETQCIWSELHFYCTNCLEMGGEIQWTKYRFGVAVPNSHFLNREMGLKSTSDFIKVQ